MLQALLDHTKGGLSAAEVVLVVSNVAGVKGLQRAQEAGVATKVRTTTTLHHLHVPSTVNQLVAWE